MTEHHTIADDDLNTWVEFDHPFRVHADRTVSDTGPSLAGIYAPSVYHQKKDEQGREMDIDGDSGWFPWSAGYTGQYSYNGPVMHASEQLQGRIATDLLDSPGVYVICAVEVLCDDECDDDECTGEHEPAGWTVLRLSHLETTDIVMCVTCWCIFNQGGIENMDPDEGVPGLAAMEAYEAEHPTPADWHLVPGDYEWDFARFDCDTCGSGLAGTFNRAHYLYPRTRALTEHETTEWRAGHVTFDHPTETEHGVTVREDLR